jgi:putative transposase
VDTLGLLLAVFVTAASVTDAWAAHEVFRRARGGNMPRLVNVLGDHVYGYANLPEWTVLTTEFILEITGKDSAQQGEGKKEFTVVKWGWVVERPFAWLGRYRRTSRD